VGEPVRIENRSQLIYLLAEAAELEHGIMCCYLFALFSLKNSMNEGVSDAQLTAIRRWRRLIRQIALEEMLHLASACNLLTAIGGAPQMRRPNLPTSPKAYGASFRLQLASFSLDTLDQFIAIEKPTYPDDEESALTRRELPVQVRPRLTDIFSGERDFDTQGRLYRGIEDGIAYLAQKYGEKGLFIGPPEAQTTGRHFPNLPGLIAVADLASASAALTIIVEQGEGASRDSVDSHYSKFVSIRQEYAKLLAEDPTFVPGRNVLSNPYSLFPTDMTASAEINLIEDETTAYIANFFDGCYELLVQMLGRLFVHAEESDEQLVRLAEISEGLMIEIIEPLGTALTMLPAGPSYGDLRAGPSFRLSRGAMIPTHSTSAWFVFHERMMELSAYCRFLQTNADAPSVLGRVRDAIVKYADLLKAMA
jgi:hypothetical protein